MAGCVDIERIQRRNAYPVQMWAREPGKGSFPLEVYKDPGWARGAIPQTASGQQNVGSNPRRGHDAETADLIDTLLRTATKCIPWDTRAEHRALREPLCSERAVRAIVTLRAGLNALAADHVPGT